MFQRNWLDVNLPIGLTGEVRCNSCDVFKLTYHGRIPLPDTNYPRNIM